MNNLVARLNALLRPGVSSVQPESPPPVLEAELPIVPPEQLPDPGEALVRHFEQCRLEPYLCSAGKPTIGWGSTYYPDDRPVSLDDPPLTKKQAEALFQEVFGKFRRGVDALLPGHAPLHHRGSYTSLAFNIGIGAFRQSVTLHDYRQGDLERAAEAIESFRFAGGKLLRGLQIRRRAERLVFEGASVLEAIRRAEKAFPRR